LPGGRRAALLILLSLFIFHFSLFTSAQTDAPPHDTILLGDLDLAEHAEILRNQFRRITPGDFPLVQDIGTFPAVFDFADVMGPTLRGGTATVSCRPENSSHIFQHVFYIRGTNPDNASVEAMFTGQPWYALGIARWESNYPKHGTYWQFNETGDLGPLPTNSLWCPNWGYPDGWGIMQLDPPPSPQHMWDWRANVAAGLARIAEKRQIASAHLTTQITHQMEDNPEDTLASHVFTIGGLVFQVGTSKNPLDACAIQAYNGAASFVIYWKRKTATDPGS
jgi:hypothetical protein